MKVIVRDKAFADIRRIAEFIALNSKAAARSVSHRIFDAIDDLENFPNRFANGRAPNTRERQVPSLPYVIVYDPGTEEHPTVVLAVFHSAQDR